MKKKRNLCTDLIEKKGLTGLRRRRARIQLASTLRNNGKTEQSIPILREEKNHYSDELNDAVDSFLALSLSSAEKYGEALSLGLKQCPAICPDTTDLSTIMPMICIRNCNNIFLFLLYEKARSPVSFFRHGMHWIPPAVL